MKHGWVSVGTVRQLQRDVTLDTRPFDVPSLTLLVIPLLYSGATSRVTQHEFSNRASQAAVLPARGCDARKCIKPLVAS